MKNTCPFRSFWMGGFECSDQLNHFGNRVDLLSETGHIKVPGPIIACWLTWGYTRYEKAFDGVL